MTPGGLNSDHLKRAMGVALAFHEILTVADVLRIAPLWVPHHVLGVLRANGMLANVIGVPTVPPELIFTQLRIYLIGKSGKTNRSASVICSGHFHCSFSPLRIRRAMTSLSEILEHNRSFVARKEYEAFRTDRFPNRSWSCWDAWTPGWWSSCRRRWGFATAT